MKVRTHYELAKIVIDICDEHIPAGFSMKMFRLGLFLIDQTWHVATHPHFAQKSLDYICEMLAKLHSRKRFNAYDSLQLGFIVHYLCDFCCSAHRSGEIGILTEHIGYEHELQKYLMKNQAEISKIIHASFRGSNLYMLKQHRHIGKAQIEQKLVNYFHSEKDFLGDIISSIELSVMVSLSVFQTANDNSIAAKIQPVQHRLPGFQTGSKM